MVSFTINLEVMSRVGAQQNGTFRWWHEMQWRDTTPVKQLMALKRLAVW